MTTESIRQIRRIRSRPSSEVVIEAVLCVFRDELPLPVARVRPTTLVGRRPATRPKGGAGHRWQQSYLSRGAEGRSPLQCLARPIGPIDEGYLVKRVRIPTLFASRLACTTCFAEWVDEARLSMTLGLRKEQFEPATSSARLHRPRSSGRRSVGYRTVRGAGSKQFHMATPPHQLIRRPFTPITLDQGGERCWTSRSTTWLA